VFPRRTEYSPFDDMAFYDVPGMFIPDHDEVHVCCVFTWDKERAEELRFQWQGYTDKPVLIGGPAYGDAGGDFVPGRYVKPGIVFTSRGCPNKCKFCFVPHREGPLRELPVIHPGHIIQDNNFLACTEKHKAKVYEMLADQKAVEFAGGLEAARLTEFDIQHMLKLRLKELWFAADTPQRLPVTLRAIKRLSAEGLSRHKIRCFVLIGNDMQENESRLRAVYEAGAYPFAQLYQPETDKRIEYSREWRELQRVWTRPPAQDAVMKAGQKLEQYVNFRIKEAK
jgi:hypothetical protein